MTELYSSMRVYVEDTDAGGIVYHANYLKYMERARTELMRSLGYSKPALFDGLQLVVHQLSIKYIHPALLDDEIRVLARLDKVKRVSFLMTQMIFREGICLAEADVKIACLDARTKKPAAIPLPMYAKLKGLND
ncbi:MAG: YbgC/FadM family acyl-CoA thioesterase [Porticoccaceae bacterium]|nr:YbgC/FadM family acyl-CoA thioesterase [Porticoccaceae bacterium]